MIVLDPPAYGHSPAGKRGVLRGIFGLLDACFHFSKLFDASTGILLR